MLGLWQLYVLDTIRFKFIVIAQNKSSSTSKTMKCSIKPEVQKKGHFSFICLLLSFVHTFVWLLDRINEGIQRHRVL